MNYQILRRAYAIFFVQTAACIKVWRGHWLQPVLDAHHRLMDEGKKLMVEQAMTNLDALWSKRPALSLVTVSRRVLDKQRIPSWASLIFPGN